MSCGCSGRHANVTSKGPDFLMEPGRLHQHDTLSPICLPSSKSSGGSAGASTTEMVAEAFDVFAKVAPPAVFAAVGELDEGNGQKILNYVQSIKTRMTAPTGFNLCDHHQERAGGTTQGNKGRPRSSTLKQLRADLRRPPAEVNQPVLDAVDASARNTQPRGKETRVELFAVNLYSRNDIYRQFNSDHRVGRADRWRAMSNTLQCAIEHLPAPPVGTVLYRGSNDPVFKSAGETDCFEQFTSASVSRSTAERFIDSIGGTLFEIHGVPSTHCGMVDHISCYPHEGEVLIVPGTCFSVEQVDRSRQPARVRLRYTTAVAQASASCRSLRRRPSAP
jgi:hypothetical protein